MRQSSILTKLVPIKQGSRAGQSKRAEVEVIALNEKVNQLTLKNEKIKTELNNSEKVIKGLAIDKEGLQK